MSVRHAMLALLSEGPKYGLQLREEFEARTGEVWPLNGGQVYTTLQRLERDGLVESDGTGEEGPQKGFRITAEGERELARWLRTPPDLSSPPRDELVMKVLVALYVPSADVHAVIQAHRRYLVELMQQWTRIKEDDAGSDLSMSLAIDAELFRLDSVVRWLDAAEARVNRAAADGSDDLGGPGEPRKPDTSAAATAPAGSEEYGDEHAGAAPGVQVLRARGRRGARPARGQPDGRRRRDGRGDGTQRLGQEHAADHRRNPGGADLRRGADRRPAGQQGVSRRQGAAAAARDRLRIPGLQPAARADRGGERLAAA